MVKRAVFVLLPLFISVSAVFAGAQNDSSELIWKLGLLNNKTGKMISFEQPIQSWDGQEFIIKIEPQAPCYCYIIAEKDDGDEVGYLYSGSIQKGEDWNSSIMILSPPSGSEALYVIISREEQKTLAQRISALNDSVSSQRAVMNEIFRLRGELSQFKEVPEKPVLMGGASRSTTPDAWQGVEYSGLKTYVKTIIIEH